MILRDKQKYFASEAITYTHYLKRMCRKQQKGLNPGSLILVRNHIIDSQRGQKLEVK